MHKQLSNFAEVRSAGNGANVVGIDTANYDGVMFIALETGNNLEMKARQSATIDGSGHLSGTVEDISAVYESRGDGEIMVIDIYRPDKRYVGVHSANAATDINGEIFALRYHSRNRPVDNDVEGTVKLAQLVSPDVVV